LKQVCFPPIPYKWWCKHNTASKSFRGSNLGANRVAFQHETSSDLSAGLSQHLDLGPVLHMQLSAGSEGGQGKTVETKQVCLALPEMV